MTVELIAQKYVLKGEHHQSITLGIHLAPRTVPDRTDTYLLD
jgi:hypothetical protein